MRYNLQVRCDFDIPLSRAATFNNNQGDPRSKHWRTLPRRDAIGMSWLLRRVTVDSIIYAHRVIDSCMIAMLDNLLPELIYVYLVTSTIQHRLVPSSNENGGYVLSGRVQVRNSFVIFFNGNQLSLTYYWHWFLFSPAEPATASRSTPDFNNNPSYTNNLSRDLDK